MTCMCCSQGHAPPAQLASAQLFAAKLGTGPQRVVMLKGMTRAITLFNQKDQDEVNASKTLHACTRCCKGISDCLRILELDSAGVIAR